MKNRLSQESSPYLQQHANNPVDWYPWGQEALDKAKAEDKPILVSIGYSTCHWCHVMERESFEDEAVAAYMNKNFVNIKVDREERPDLDAIYMEAVQLVQNGQGGWPLNCFLLPDGRPFFGGTYFPPSPAYQRASWQQVLENLRNAFDTRRKDVEEQANKIFQYMEQAQSNFVSNIDLKTEGKNLFNKDLVHQTYKNLRTAFDNQNGGFGAAPKFPGTMALEFCLNYHLAEKNKEALEHLLLSLDKMAMGGIYDHLGGGFSRYTVDESWLIPHFEKMLYDNALLVSLLADTYKLEAKDLYKRRIEETFVWLEQEMLSEEGGFYAALDADSEGVEGKFYIWSKAEIDTILGDSNFKNIGKRNEFFCNYYDISEHGNWEHQNIINIPQDTLDFIDKQDWNAQDKTDIEDFLSDCRKDLLAARSKRIRPGLDDKILLDWNALMITAYCKAYQALGKEEYKDTALKALHFVLDKFRISNNSLHLYHSYKDGQAKHHAFLDDYALLIEALLEVYYCTQDKQYSSLAKDYSDFVCNEFLDFKDNVFFFTSAKQQDILLHKKAVYDSATPSGNSTMVHNLQQLSILFDNNKYREQAQKTLLAVGDNLERYPQSFGRWANALFVEVYPLKTITVIGTNQEAIIKELLSKNLINTLVTTQTSSLTQAAAKSKDENQTALIVCKNYACNLPVYSIKEALELL